MLFMHIHLIVCPIFRSFVSIRVIADSTQLVRVSLYSYCRKCMCFSGFYPSKEILQLIGPKLPSLQRASMLLTPALTCFKCIWVDNFKRAVVRSGSDHVSLSGCYNQRILCCLCRAHSERVAKIVYALKKLCALHSECVQHVHQKCTACKSACSYSCVR